MRQRQEILPPVMRPMRHRQLAGLGDAIGTVESYGLNMGTLGGAGLLFMGPIGAVIGAGIGYLLTPGLAQVDQMVEGGGGQGSQPGAGSMFSGTNGAILLLGGVLAVAFYTQAAGGTRRK